MWSGRLACNAALHELLLANAGDNEKPKLRAAREDDRWLVSPVVDVTFGAFRDVHSGKDYPETTMGMIWQIKNGDCQIELTAANLDYCFAAIWTADPVERRPRASPKKRRKLKRVDAQDDLEG